MGLFGDIAHVFDGVAHSVAGDVTQVQAMASGLLSSALDAMDSQLSGVRMAWGDASTIQATAAKLESAATQCNDIRGTTSSVAGTIRGDTTLWNSPSGRSAAAKVDAKSVPLTGLASNMSESASVLRQYANKIEAANEQATAVRAAIGGGGIFGDIKAFVDAATQLDGLVVEMGVQSVAVGDQLTELAGQATRIAGLTSQADIHALSLSAQLTRMMEHPVSQSQFAAFEKELAGLSPAARAEFDTLIIGNGDAARLGYLLSPGSDFWGMISKDASGHDLNLSAPQTQNLYNLIFGSAPAWEVASLTEDFPGVNPSLNISSWSNAQKVYNEILRSPLDGGGAANPNDISQGSIGDCYFLSSLIAIASADPSFVANHIHSNGNGTSTVTLYENGQPVQVTVTDTAPSSGVTSSGGSWPQLYEKAYAQLRGCYGVINQGGWGTQGLTAVSGAAVASGSLTVTQLAQLLNSNHAVVIGTNNNNPATNDYVGYDQVSGHKLIDGHEYMVQSVNPNGTVTLRNPWDPTDTPTLTWSQIEAQSDEVAWTTSPV